jgi:hypothetical protein
VGSGERASGERGEGGGERRKGWRRIGWRWRRGRGRRIGWRGEGVENEICEGGKLLSFVEFLQSNYFDMAAKLHLGFVCEFGLADLFGFGWPWQGVFGSEEGLGRTLVCGAEFSE